jgi:O-acetyl-ADP-ribose deacetylase (regulator of RNase III)
MEKTEAYARQGRNYGDCFMTDAGTLPVQALIHLVTIMIVNGNPRPTTEATMRMAINGALNFANNNHFKSVSLPVDMAKRFFSDPVITVEEATRRICDEWVNTMPNSTIEEIILVEFAQ